VTEIFGSGPGAPSAPVLEPLLVAENMTKRYGSVIALSNMGLTIGRGEHVAIVGDNGAGKSTLVKILSGATHPDSGQLRFADHHIDFKSPVQAKSLGIETVFQTLALVDDLDIAANLFLGREMVRWRWGAMSIMDRKGMKKKAREIIQETGVNIQDISVTVSGLSGGQRQGVAISRAVGWGSQLVILDEPTAALGVRETEQVEGIVRGLKARGIAVLLVSHNLQQVFRLVDRIVVMRRGQLAGVRDANDTTPDDLVSLITGASADRLVEG
jgi:ABC-type sugar transport system ATPase subunit